MFFIPGYGWWYAITVIDYDSRSLLAAYLTRSDSAAEAIRALEFSQAEPERVCRPLTQRPFLVTDNGPSFIARRFGAYLKGLFSHVRIRYRTPTQLGLLERFHGTLKCEEAYWRMYDNPGPRAVLSGRVQTSIQHLAAALGPIAKQVYRAVLTKIQRTEYAEEKREKTKDKGAKKKEGAKRKRKNKRGGGRRDR